MAVEIVIPYTTAVPMVEREAAEIREKRAKRAAEEQAEGAAHLAQRSAGAAAPGRRAPAPRPAARDDAPATIGARARATRARTPGAEFAAGLFAVNHVGGA